MAYNKKSHHWTDEEDRCLVTSLLELYNLGTFIAENGFRSGYLSELEKMIMKLLPDSEIRAKPHIESRLKTLKKDFTTVYDMVYGPNTSGFGWDPVTKCVVAEKPVWDEYIKSHPRAGNYKNRRFENFEELCDVWGKDRAVERRAVDIADVMEEVHENTTQNPDIESYMPPMDWLNGGEMPSLANEEKTSQNPTPRSEETSSFARKRKSRSCDAIADSLNGFLNTLGVQMKEVSSQISNAIGTEMRFEERRAKLYAEVQLMEGLTHAEKYKVAKAIAADDSDLVYYFSIPKPQRQEFVRGFL